MSWMVLIYKNMLPDNDRNSFCKVVLQEDSSNNLYRRFPLSKFHLLFYNDNMDRQMLCPHNCSIVSKLTERKLKIRKVFFYSCYPPTNFIKLR